MSCECVSVCVWGGGGGEADDSKQPILTSGCPSPQGSTDRQLLMDAHGMAVHTGYNSTLHHIPQEKSAPDKNWTDC